jgi:hypothetical protein
MKFCKDCRHFKYNWFTGPATGRCHHPVAIADNENTLVTGYSPQYATIVREYGPCGKEATLFEDKA